MMILRCNYLILNVNPPSKPALLSKQSRAYLLISLIKQVLQVDMNKLKKPENQTSDIRHQTSDGAAIQTSINGPSHNLQDKSAIKAGLCILPRNRINHVPYLVLILQIII